MSDDSVSRRDFVNQDLFYIHILSNKDRAKKYTERGGSLDKLRGAAEKALKNANSDEKRQIYESLQSAIEGKRVYYKDSKKGQIITAKISPIFQNFLKRKGR